MIERWLKQKRLSEWCHWLRINGFGHRRVCARAGLEVLVREASAEAAEAAVLVS